MSTSSGQLRGRTIKGTVVRGEQRGRDLGFPTANIEVPAGLELPPFGVYATWAFLDGVRYQSATNIGLRPHFDGDEPSVETYIFDFDGDIYGRDLKIELVELISPELKFEGVEQLKAKIAADVARAREILRE